MLLGSPSCIRESAKTSTASMLRNLRSCACVQPISCADLCQFSPSRLRYSGSAWHDRFEATVTMPRHEAAAPTPDPFRVWGLLVSFFRRGREICPPDRSNNRISTYLSRSDVAHLVLRPGVCAACWSRCQFICG
jgi:hypothetical protein